MTAKKRRTRRPQRATSQSPRLSNRQTADGLGYSAYEITDESLEDRNLRHLPVEVRDTIDDLYEQAQHAPKDAIPELERRVATYPDVPLFTNHLTVAYGRAGERDKAEALMVESYRRHPRYLFAKVNYAQLCLSKGEVAKVPGIFNHTFDLKALYPLRKRFHIDEFVGFTSVMCLYLCAIDQRHAASLQYQMLQQVAPRHPMTKHARRVLYAPFWIRWLRKWAGKRMDTQPNHPKRLGRT